MSAEHPLRVGFVITPAAQAEVDAALDWLESFSTEAAERFDAALRTELLSLCRRLEAGLRPSPEETASLFYSRPVFQHILRTGQQRRHRTSSGAWRIYYELRDTDDDGEPDTLRVLSVRHAAARPLSIEGDDEGEE